MLNNASQFLHKDCQRHFFFDEKEKTYWKYVYYSIVHNFHAQSNIKNDFLKALSVLSCKHKKQVKNTYPWYQKG